MFIVFLTIALISLVFFFIATKVEVISTPKVFIKLMPKKMFGQIIFLITFAIGFFGLLIVLKDFMIEELYSSIKYTITNYIAYFVIIALVLLLIYFVCDVPKYIFRKILHVVAFCSIFPILESSTYWQVSAICVALFILLINMLLLTAENYDFYNDLFAEKNKHEVMLSFSIFFAVIALLIIVFWGLLGENYKYYSIVPILSWGPGDAMAAIIGIKYGKHKITGKIFDGTKTFEGSIANLITTIICVFISLLFVSTYSIGLSILISLIIGISCSFVELITKKGLDTLTVSLTSTVILLPVILL